MFLKQYRVKSSGRLKSPDVKLLRQRLEKSFPDANLEVLLPIKSCITKLKIVTSSEFQTNVYCLDKLPIFFEIEADQLVPTLYSIWKEPNLLPCFTTWESVFPKLSNGADLMLPGVQPLGTGMNMYGRFKKGQLVSINLNSNQAAVGIGYLPRSSDDMYMSGGQGIAVKVLHIFGDKLWAHDPNAAQQLPFMKPEKLTDEGFPALSALDRKTSKKPNVEEEQITEISTVVASADGATSLPDINELNISASITNIQSTKMANEDTPELILKNAFLTALKNNGKKLQLPLLTSNFFRLYILPEATQQIDLKKTKYKKLSNFLTEMADKGFIVVREESKGVDKITDIDFDHPELLNFITDYKKTTTNSNGVDPIEQPLFHSELTELYIVTDVTAPFFTRMNYKRGEGIPAGQIKKIVREYVKKQSLPFADEARKKIQLDEILYELCKETTATLTEITAAITDTMEHSFQMCSGKDSANNKPLIQLSLANRSFNKKVTLISNLDCYGIILTEFMKLCKQGAAASTTVVKLPNQKREQIQIQGNQIRFVYNLLINTYKVPSKSILGLELAKRDKKKST